MSVDARLHSILVVDDNQENLRVIGTTLEAAGYQVGFAMNGRKALEILQEGSPYDLVLLDVNMPVMNGYDTCAAIRANEALREIPVIFLTAFDDAEHLLTGFEVGGQDYVTKPFSAPELLSRVKTHVELKVARDRLSTVNRWLEERVEERTRELHLANEQLENAHHELLKLDEAKDDFLHLIGHEIRTPLTGIVGLTEFLGGELRATRHAETIAQLWFSVRRLERFAMSAILITGFRNNNVLLQFESCPIDGLIASSMERMKQSADQHRITMLAEGECRAGVMCDARLIGLCLDNILDNAIRYSPQEGTVVVRCTRGEGSVECEIRDRGKGFTAQALERIFELFELGEKHTDQHKGLGLALSKRIIDAHNGAIVADNHPDGGARVRMTLLRG